MQDVNIYANPIVRRCAAALGALALLVGLWQPAAVAAEPGEPVWTEGQFCLPQLNGTVRATAVWDDGTGESLYVAGSFTIAGCVNAVSIARWDGSSWSALPGFAETSPSSGIRALAVFDDGTGPALYAGGGTLVTEGPDGIYSSGYIAKWDGASWSLFTGSSGISGGQFTSINALTVFDDGTGSALYAAGNFPRAGGLLANNIAKWDGSSWSVLANASDIGTNDDINALAIFDDGSGPALYVGGAFTSAGGIQTNRVARWDGLSWSSANGASGTNPGGYIHAMTVFDDGSGPALYAGGDSFGTPGVPTNSTIARWDGSSWSPLHGPSGSGTNNIVRALQVFDNGSGPALYVGGSFTSAGGVPTSFIAHWDGSVWSALSGPSGNGVSGPGVTAVVYALAVFDEGAGPALYAGGEFITAGGIPAVRMARWDGSSWSALVGSSGHGVNRDVYAMTVFDDGSGPALYVGGVFSTAGDVIVNGIAKWDGHAWSALTGPNGTGMSEVIVAPEVRALAVFDDGSGPALYAGGRFRSAGGVLVNGIAKWDGETWSALIGPSGTGVSSGTASAVNALKVFDDGSGPALYAGGSFLNAGNVWVNRIAKWDGNEWAALSGSSGTGVAGGSLPSVDALEVFDDGTGPALYVGGGFLNAGGIAPVGNIAKWDGNEWTALDGPSAAGVNGRVKALTVFDDGTGAALYVGGGYSTAGGIPMNMGRWNGSTWSALDDSNETRVSYSLTLVVMNDGSGPALYSGGQFRSPTGQVILGQIARWNGSSWSELAGPSGVGFGQSLPDVYALAVLKDEAGSALYAGGAFSTAGGVRSNRIARWNGCPPQANPCPADLTGPALDGEPDEIVSTSDLNYYLMLWLAQDSAADIAGPQHEQPDGLVDASDLETYVAWWLTGLGSCP